jgi:hypothetical protein
MKTDDDGKGRGKVEAPVFLRRDGKVQDRRGKKRLSSPNLIRRGRNNFLRPVLPFNKRSNSLF